MNFDLTSTYIELSLIFACAAEDLIRMNTLSHTDDTMTLNLKKRNRGKALPTMPRLSIASICSSLHKSPLLETMLSPPTYESLEISSVDNKEIRHDVAGHRVLILSTVQVLTL